MKIKLNVDRTPHQAKPTGAEIAYIRKRLANGSAEIQPEEITALIENGGSFTPALMADSGGDSWQSQQIIVVDIDNDEEATDENGNKIKDETGHVIKVPIKNPLSSKRAAALCAAAGITPYCIYHTFSNGKEYNGVKLEKYRIVLILEEPITDKEEAVNITDRFTNIFNGMAPGAADTTMADAARLIFGSYKGSIINNSGSITPLEVVRALPPIQPEKTAPTPRQDPAKYETRHQARQYDDIKAQRRYDVENFDLYDYIMQTERPAPHEHRSGNATYLNPCPICGHNDDFVISGNVWHCFSASSGKGAGKDGKPGGTIIDYIMHRENKTLQEALKKFDNIMNYEEPAPKIRPQSDFLEEKAEPADDKEITAKNEILPGLLTYEAAVNTFATANDKYIEMAKFPEFCKRAKIKTHDSVVIAADTGAGKSSLALNFIDNLNDNYPVIYFNLEMDELTALRRLVSIRTGVELDRIEGYQHDENTAELVNSALKIITSRQPLQIIQDKYSISDIEAEIKRATKGREEPTIVVIDHSLLVTTEDNFTRYERFTQISEQLRKISRLNNVIMFILLQQNRSGKEDETKRPTNSSLKESGSWENDATQIIFLWFDPEERIKKMLLTKNRGGITGEFNLEYYATTQFYKEAKEQPADTNRKAKRKRNKRDQERDQLQTWYEKAYIATGGQVTLYDLAEAAGTTTAVVKRRLKEFGGYVVDGEQYDAAGIDTDIEQAEFIRLTMSDAPAWEDDNGISDIY